MIKPEMCNYNDFPADKSAPEGMKVIGADKETHYVKWIKDVEYTKRGDKALYMQILRPNKIEDHIHFSPKPAKPAKPWPIVVYVPGSAWHKQDVYSAVTKLTRLAERGFVVALVEYRPSEEAIFPAQIIDAKAAVRYIKENAEEYFANPESVVIFGDSSGGHTSLMTAFTGEANLVDDMDKLENFDCSVNGVISYFPPVDISRMCEAPSVADHTLADSPEGYLIGRKKVLENLDLVKPTVVTNYIEKSKEIPPVLAFHGDKDRIVPFNQSCILYDALIEAEKEVDFYKIEGGDHGGASFWSNDVLEVVEEFINKVNK